MLGQAPTESRLGNENTTIPHLLRVKDNQGNLPLDLQDWFAHAEQVQFANMDSNYAKTIDKGHGRIERG